MYARLQSFLEAQDKLYGPLSSITSPATWVPPERSGGHRGRYLWTDAFGVINFLTLYKESLGLSHPLLPNLPSPESYLILAARLVATVHSVLGSTRAGDSLLPGATTDEPLGGGLRIGKIDEFGEDCDGQYHHYLTLWMFALNRLSIAASQPEYNQQAIGLMKATHSHFFRGANKDRMVWKVSTDLQTALVQSEGSLDPLDGFIIGGLLREQARRTGEGDVLEEEIKDYRRVLQRRGQVNVDEDPLDLGMVLWIAQWASRDAWASEVTNRGVIVAQKMLKRGYFGRNISTRPPFREFGAAMGLGCVAGDKRPEDGVPGVAAVYGTIIDIWTAKLEGKGKALIDLEPISCVMYAAALIPGAFRPGYFEEEPTMNSADWTQAQV